MPSKTPIMNRSLQNGTIVSRIIDQITEAIIAGELLPGSRLPTELELSNSFQVGRNSVREAVKILEAYGVVYIKRADGTYINDTFNQKMLDPMLYGILLQKSSSAELLQMRKVLDTGILHHVMQEFTPDEFVKLEKSLLKLTDEITAKEPKTERILRADVEFHMDIVRAMNNELLLCMYSYVDRITIASRADAIDMVLESGNISDFIELHTRLVNIIKSKKLEDVEETLAEHYVFWKQVL